jgi:hypothetical protein
LREAAERHLATALAIEKEAGTEGSSHAPKGPGKYPGGFSDSFYYRAIRTRIGQVLRSVPTEPVLSERLRKALDALDPATGSGEGNATADDADTSVKR